MKVEEFRNLDPVDQDIIVWEKAILIGVRADAVYKYILYQLDGFYIEIRITGSNLETVKRTFTGDTLLEPYLQAIELTELNGLVSS
ncbi:MAG: hypothetical protein ABIN74_13475 [Ferruginibacter sp.]